MHKQYENKDSRLRPNSCKACHQYHEWLTEMYLASSDVFESSLHIQLLKITDILQDIIPFIVLLNLSCLYFE